MLICILKFDILSDGNFESAMLTDSDFGNDLSSDGLKVSILGLLISWVESVTMTNCQMGCEWWKKKPCTLTQTGHISSP